MYHVSPSRATFMHHSLFFLFWYLKSNFLNILLHWIYPIWLFKNYRKSNKVLNNNLWIYITRYKCLDKCSKRFLIFVYRIMTDNSKRKIDRFWFDSLEFARRKFSSLSLLIQLNGFSPANSMFFHFFAEWFWRGNLASVTQVQVWLLFATGLRQNRSSVLMPSLMDGKMNINIAGNPL